MTRQAYELSSEVLRTTQKMTLWKNEKGIVEVNDNTPVIPVKLDEEARGYVFGGKGRLVVDAIVETTKGAIGEPVERDIKRPFLMMGNTETIQESLKPLEEEDFVNLEIKTKDEFLNKAEDLLDRFFEGSSGKHRGSSFNKGDGFIFAFPNEKDKLDILVCKDSKLVYTSLDKVFVSKRNKVVLTSHGDVVVSKPGKSIFVSNGECSSVHIHKSET
jgi:hypothetical protein